MLSRKSWQKRRGQSGDTIVEVMIVLAVLGMAIGVSYATANRSLSNARQAQEASLATQLVQSQVESLQTLAPGGTIYNDRPFCITNSGSGPAVHVITGAADTACKLGEDNRYAITINWNGASPPAGSPQPASDTFTVKASWDDIEGQGTDTATMSYRLPKNAATVGAGGGGGGGGGIGVGGGGGVTPLGINAVNKQCHVYFDNGFGGGYSNKADVVVTGPANSTVTVSVVTKWSFYGVTTYNNDYSLTLDKNGNGTLPVNLGSLYGTVTGTATVNYNGQNAGPVSVCP